MACVVQGGHRTWSLDRDREGHRTYKVIHLVKTDSPGSDGPANAILAPGLPLPGSLWAFGSDLDPWATCQPDARVTPYEVKEGEKNSFFLVEQTFTTKPPDRNQQRCSDVRIEDPLLEPAKISGGFVKYTEEANYDRLGELITNSAHEQIRGPQVEFDRNRPTVKIEQNVATPLQAYRLPIQMLDTVNTSTLWGLPPRTVKLSNVTWERRFYGQCYLYYNRVLEFDINFSTFDRDLLDEGTKVLHGHWSDVTDTGTGGAGASLWELDNIAGSTPDPSNPQHFIRATDRQGNPIKVVLNGAGLPAVNVGIPITAVQIIPKENDIRNIEVWRYTTGTPHGLEDAETVNIIGAKPPYYSGEFEIDAIFSTTKFDVQAVAEDADPYTRGGFVLTANGSTGTIHVEKYDESDFLSLGIPIQF